MEHRLAIAASSREALRDALAAAADGQTPTGAARGRVSGAAPKVVFVFPGQGSQWVGMGQTLLAQEPVFRAALAECDRAIQLEAGWSLLAELADADASKEDRIDVVQPALFAVSLALAALWRSWGVEPDAVVGHSMGEVAAAHLAGVLSLADAVAIVCRRSALLRRIRGRGEMALVDLSAADATALLRGYEDRLSVAAINGARATVIAGEPAALAEVLAELATREVFHRRVHVDVASHSPQVEPLRAELLAALADLQPQRVAVPMRSTVTAAAVAGPELGASYWADNLRQPVRFAEAVQALLDGGHGLFVEMSPHPILVAAVDELRRSAGRAGVAVGSLRRGQDTRAVLLESLAALWVHGHAVAWARLIPGGKRVSLPSYPWQRERHWIAARPRAVASVADVADGLLDAADGADLAQRLGLAAGGATEAAVLDRVLAALRARSREADVRGWMYTLAWRSLARRTAATTSGRWVVLVDGGGVGDRVADALEAAGATCTRVRIGAAFERVAADQDVWSVDPTSPTNLAAWWSERLATWGPVRGVLHLWSLGEAPRSADDVDAALRRGVHTALAWVQALVRTDHRHRARLWLATAGAVAVDADDRVTSPEHAPLWGLGRVIASERPDLWGGLIDLGHQPDAAAVVAELVVADGEDQVALRSSGRYVPRIVRPGPASAARPWSASGTALITGGLGALGLHLARWLARRGVKHLVLVSRRGRATPGAAEAVASLESLGASVTVAQADVADAAAMAAVLADIDARSPPLSAVFHAAGVLDDGILERQDASRFATVLAPKVLGAWNLHILTRHRPLAAFVLFSSLASLLGSPGLGSYAAGNAYLDALAATRRAEGLAGQSVNWGAWRDGGMASRKLLEEAERRGARAMRPDDALAALSVVLAGDLTQVAVADTDWSRAHTHFEGARRLTSEMADPAATAASASTEPGVTLDQLRTTALDGRAERIAGHLRRLVAEVLGMHEVPEDRDFLELGMDSLTMNRVLVKLRRDLQLSVFAQEMFDHPSVAALSRYLAREMEPAAPAPATAEPPDLELFSNLPVQARSTSVTLPGERVPGPVFVLSSPRSGSTLLRVMLAGHSRLLSPPELHLLPFETMGERARSLGEGQKKGLGEGLVRVLMELRGIDAEASGAMVRRWEEEDLPIQAVYRRLHDMAEGRLVVDKSPSYVSRLATLLRAEALFEGARYVQLVRHPYAVIESIVRNRMHRLTMSTDSPHDPLQIAEQVWTHGNTNMSTFLRDVPPDRRHLIRYEDMVEDPERAMRALCTFLDIPFESATLDPYRGDRMTDGVRPESSHIGDPNFHTHDAIDRDLGAVWTKIQLPRRLGPQTRQTAADLGYALPFDPPAPPHDRPSSPLRELQPHGRGTPFFCVPGLEGSALALSPLAQHLGQDRPCFGLHDDGLAGEPRIEDTAARYIAAVRGAQPDGPYLLGGWSFGGVVAFEMARQLTRDGHRVGFVAMLDTRAVHAAKPTPEEPAEAADRRMTTQLLTSLARGHDLPIEDLHPFGSDPQLAPILKLLQDVHLLAPTASVADARRLLAALTARLRAKWQYAPPLPPYPGPLVLFRARERRAEEPADASPTLGWSAFSSQPVTVYDVPGNHFTMLRAPHVQDLASQLRRCLRTADPRVTP
jgi:acyl transferase domain-containing protein/thioesterase domain-containing protein